MGIFASTRPRSKQNGCICIRFQTPLNLTYAYFNLSTRLVYTNIHHHMYLHYIKLTSIAIELYGRICCPNSINYVLKKTSVSKSRCEWAEYDMLHDLILSAAVNIDSSVLETHASQILSNKIHADGVIYEIY